LPAPPAIVVLPIAPDPVAIARSVAARDGLAVLTGRRAGPPRPLDVRWSFVACDPIETSDALVPAVRAAPCPGPWPRWIGTLPYEALRGVERPAWTRAPDDRPRARLSGPAWSRYAAVVRIDHATGQVAVVGDDDASVARLAHLVRSPRAPAPADCALHASDPREPDREHLDRIRAALELIAAGDLYEVNLARRISLSFRGNCLSLFERLLAHAPAAWAFLQDLGEDVVCASSPELAIQLHDDVLRTCPIKGTRPRARDARHDACLAAELDADPKERAELTMAVDVHRNDLGRVAVPGSVRAGLPRLLAGKTVWSRVVEVTARKAPTASLEDVVRAVLPCGSVTGAPKARAMEVIARLEPWRRGLYTGAFGYVGADGSLVLAVAIRTLQLEPVAGRGVYFAGGGIVADSAPERELEETRWKASHLAALA
jgi:anthranilate/para-aminobenzoate synthase component I